jgi:ABC-2 type transport system permease protein
MNRIWQIIRKEWAELFKNRIVLFAVAFMPLLFTAIPLILLQTMGSDASTSGSLQGATDIPSSFLAQCGTLTGIDCMQYFMVSQFLLLFLIMPIFIPSTIASYSIVGEKTNRTLEPLLATPITTLELLAGKALAGVIPALMVTWSSFSVFLIGARLLASSPQVVLHLLSGVWLIAIFVLSPLLSIAGVSAAVIISSRVNDPRVAEQLSSLVILPVMALFFGQIFGLIYLNQNVIFWMALILVVVDSALLYLTIQLFQRENILTRWK